MPVRLVITTYAKPGKGTELARAMADRCRAVQQEPGCQQFEVFQSALAPIRSSHSNSGLTRRRSTRTPGSTPPGRRTWCWLLSVPMASAPRRLPLQPDAVAPRTLAPLAVPACCGAWRLGQAARWGGGAALRCTMASPQAHVVRGPAVP